MLKQVTTSVGVQMWNHNKPLIETETLEVETCANFLKNIMGAVRP